MRTTLVYLVLAVFVWAGTADAAVITYTSRAMWNAAIGGGPDFNEDFSSFGSDTSFVSSAVNVNGNFTLQQVNISGSRTFRNIILI